MDGLVILKTINYLSAILALLTYIASFEFLPMVKWGIFGVVILAAGTVFFTRRLFELDHGTFLHETKQGFALMGILIFLAIYKGNYVVVLNTLSPYVLIYLVSSVTVLRLQRQKQHTGENKLISRLNYMYSFLLIGFAFLLGEEHSRAYIGKILKILWKEVPEYIVKTLYELWFFIMAILAKPFIWIVSLLNGRKLDADIWEKGVGKGKPMHNFEDPYVDKLSAILNSNFVRFIIWMIILSLVIYVIFEIFQRGRNRSTNTESYEEEKEFIRRDSQRGPGMLQKMMRQMKPKGNNQLIRYYYGKLLKLCQKKQIEIKKGDTSLDVNKKSGLPPEKMTAIRETYIKVRYSDYLANKEELKRFIKTIREINDR